MKILIGFSSLFLYTAYRFLFKSKTERQADRYFPVQSSSERAAGHPIVGVS